MSDVANVTDATFATEVLEQPGTVLVDFWATWCGPCRQVSPIIDQIAAERPDVKVVKADLEQASQMATALNVTGVPTVMVFKDGQLVASKNGANPKPAYLAMLG